MKELSIEEKAKAYDEALERAEKALEVLGTDKCEGARQILSLFPELCESENEKIRKELITHCRNTRCVTEEGAKKIAKWIAWLEKQGGSYTKRDVDDAYVEGMAFAKNELEKQGKQKTWSEEDEKEYKYVLKFVDNILNNCGNKKDYEHCKRCYDWLKSLKDKIKGE